MAYHGRRRDSELWGKVADFQALGEEAIPSLDLLTTTAAGDVLGVTGQTIKNWIRQGRLVGYRVGGRIMVPKETVADYVRRARGSLDLEATSDADAARLVAEGRSDHQCPDRRELSGGD